MLLKRLRRTVGAMNRGVAAKAGSLDRPVNAFGDHDKLIARFVVLVITAHMALTVSPGLPKR
jgi:hypothetical protein